MPRARCSWSGRATEADVHPSLKTLVLLIAVIVIASLLIHMRSAFGV
jgi:hypothetical protein